MPIIFLDKLDSYKMFVNNVKDLNPDRVISKVKYLYMFSTLLRLLILCDQLHDFHETEPRNTLFNDINSNNKIKEKILNNFTTLFNKDTEYIKNLLELSLENLDGIIVKNKYTFNFYIEEKLKKIVITQQMKYHTALSIIDICGIKSVNIKKEYKQIDDKWKCTDNYKILTNQIQNTYEINNKNMEELNVFVDADKSTYNTSMITNIICDISNNMNSEVIKRVNFIDTLASDFDSAGTSKLKSLSEKFNMSDNVQFVHKDISPIILRLSESLKVVDILNIEYINVPINILNDLLNLGSDPERLKKVLKDWTIPEIKKLHVLINEKNRNKISINFQDIKLANKKKILSDLRKVLVANEVFNKDIIDNYKDVKDEDLTIPKIKELYLMIDEKNPNKIITKDQKDITSANKEYILTELYKVLRDNEVLNKDIIEKYTDNELGMRINRFYSIPGKLDTVPLERRSSECSVRGITDYVKQYLNNPNEFVKNTLFKTFGDFGQILSAYFDSKVDTSLTYFITFDEICSYMSSLFNYGTLRENLKEYEFPIDIFVPIDDFSLNIKRRTIINTLAKTVKKVVEQIRLVKTSQPSSPIKKNRFGESETRIELKRLCVKYSVKEDKHCVKNLKIKLEAKKLGLRYKRIKISKLKKQLNQLKILSKRYKLKLDKKLIHNLKILIRLQTKAKKKRISIKKKVNGNIIYKNEKELIQELKNK